MLNFFKNSLFISPNQKILNNYKILLNKVNDIESEVKLLTDNQLKDKTAYFRGVIKNGKSLDDILPEAFATVREASVRARCEVRRDEVCAQFKNG